jgi:hypothetical protein
MKEKEQKKPDYTPSYCRKIMIANAMAPIDQTALTLAL